MHVVPSDLTLDTKMYQIIDFLSTLGYQGNLLKFYISSMTVGILLVPYEFSIFHNLEGPSESL